MDGTGGESKVLQEVLADLKRIKPILRKLGLALHIVDGTRLIMSTFIL